MANASEKLAEIFTPDEATLERAAKTDDLERTNKIRLLNDQFRYSAFIVGGTLAWTPCVEVLPDEQRFRLLNRIRTFGFEHRVAKEDVFTQDNDPYGEHDFGVIEFDERHFQAKFFWKIDYYNLDRTSGAKDPSDRNNTKRVITVMLNHEY